MSLNTNFTTAVERESIKVLRECIDVQIAKSHDYQNPNSRVKQADHYLRGIDTIYDTMNGKMLRILSLLEAVKFDPNTSPKNESLEDSFKDLINYASFGVSWLRGKMEGQKINVDMFNNPKTYKISDVGELKQITPDSDYFFANGAPKQIMKVPSDKSEEWDMKNPGRNYSTGNQ